MIIKEIIRPWPRTPQCDAMLTDRNSIEWRHRNDREDPCRCNNQSRYLIGKKHYCGKHAGVKALEILMKKEKTK
jgi:hypothetical protein